MGESHRRSDLRAHEMRQRLVSLCRDERSEPTDAVPMIDSEVSALALAEGLGPLLGARLDRGTLSATTPDIRDELIRSYHGCVAWTLISQTSLRGFLVAFGQAGIPLMALKGAALVRSVMRPGERPMVDVDLLIPPSEWKRAQRLASSSGAVVFDPLDRPITAAHDYALPLMTPEGLLIELHRYLCERPLFRPDYEGPMGIFARATPSQDGLLVPEMTDLFLGLAVHAAHHAYYLPLRAIVDGLAVGASAAWTLEGVVRRARQWRAKTAVAAFLLVLRVFGFSHRDLDGALAELGAGPHVEAVIAGAPWPERNARKDDWSRRWKVAQLLDDNQARIGYIGHRIGLRLADDAWKGYLRLKGLRN